MFFTHRPGFGYCGFGSVCQGAEVTTVDAVPGWLHIATPAPPSPERNNHERGLPGRRYESPRQWLRIHSAETPTHTTTKTVVRIIRLTPLNPGMRFLPPSRSRLIPRVSITRRRCR